MPFCDDERAAGGHDHRRRALALGCAPSARRCSRTGSCSWYWPTPRQTVPPVSRTRFDRVLDRQLPARVRLRRHAGGAAAVVPLAAGGGQGVAAVGDRAGRHVPDAQPRVVVVDAARRRVVEQLDRRVGGARGEHPVVARAEALGAGRSAKLHRDAVLEQQRGARGGHGDDAGRRRHRGPGRPAWCRPARRCSTSCFWSQRRTRRLRSRGKSEFGNAAGHHVRPAAPA